MLLLFLPLTYINNCTFRLRPSPAFVKGLGPVKGDSLFGDASYFEKLLVEVSSPKYEVGVLLLLGSLV